MSWPEGGKGLNEPPGEGRAGEDGVIVLRCEFEGLQVESVCSPKRQSQSDGLRSRLWTVSKVKKFEFCVTPEEIRHNEHPLAHVLPFPLLRVTVPPGGQPMVCGLHSAPLRAPGGHRSHTPALSPASSALP